MDQFQYRDGRLYCEETSVAELAETFGTPHNGNVYSEAA